MSTPNPDSTFKPRQPKPTQHLDHPKTTKKYKNETVKRVIDIAIMRADTAFCVTKSRELAKLHTSPEWIELDSAGQQRAERKIIKRLEADRDKKKTVIENEYRYKAEVGILEPVEELIEGLEYTKHEGDLENLRLAKKSWLMCEDAVV
jgi:hypothetical protein